MSLFNYLLDLLCPCTQNLKLPAMSHSVCPSAHPSQSDTSVATSSHFSYTTEDGVKQHYRSEDKTDCRAHYEESNLFEFSDDESTFVPSNCMPIEKDTADICTSTPENRPSTRSRKAKKCKSTNNTKQIS